MARVNLAEQSIDARRAARAEIAGKMRGPVSSAFFVMLPLYKMLNIYFFRGFFGPFFCFVFPVMIIALMTAAFGSGQTAGVISMAVSGVGINGLSQTIIDFKKSVLLKRIGATPIRPWMFIFAITSYMCVISLIVTFWSLLWIVICQTTTFQPIFDNLNWGSFLLSTFYTIVLSCMIGMLIVSVSKSANAVQVLGVMITMPQYFLSGQFLPLNNLSGDPALNALSHLIPFRYTTAMYFQSFHESIFAGFGTNFELPQNQLAQIPGQAASEKLELVFYGYDRLLNFVMPVEFVAIFGFICVRTFKWSTR